MNNRNGVRWNREETILAFDLYCRLPFGKVHQNNPKVIEFASLIGRTPSSVVFKIGNLAHFDPELQKRNVNGLSNASQLDEQIFKEFNDDWEELVYQAQIIKTKMNQSQIQDIIDLGDMDTIPPGEYRERMTRTRVGQDFFRATVLTAYSNRCCITGINKSDLLIASHIKPWRVSDAKTERTNPSNGLCLNALHDRAFDKGFITLDEDYRIVISSRLKDVEMDKDTREWFYRYEGERITLPDRFMPGRGFIEYHNDMVFKR